MGIHAAAVWAARTRSQCRANTGPVPGCGQGQAPAGGSGSIPFLWLPLPRACGRVAPASASMVSVASCSVWGPSTHASVLQAPMETSTAAPITRITSHLEESHSQSLRHPGDVHRSRRLECGHRGGPCASRPWRPCPEAGRAAQRHSLTWGEARAPGHTPAVHCCPHEGTRTGVWRAARPLLAPAPGPPPGRLRGRPWPCDSQQDPFISLGAASVTPSAGSLRIRHPPTGNSWGPGASCGLNPFQAC